MCSFDDMLFHRFLSMLGHLGYHIRNQASFNSGPKSLRHARRVDSLAVKAYAVVKNVLESEHALG
jgi:hypothetical protein